MDNQKPFGSRLRSSVRVKQAEKRRLADPSLAAALLGATPDRLLQDLNTLGFLFEALCERDLRIYAESFDAELYHYQDYNNREIDAVISLPSGEWCGFEIKLGANQIDAAASGKIWCWCLPLFTVKKEGSDLSSTLPPARCGPLVISDNSLFELTL